MPKRPLVAPAQASLPTPIPTIEKSNGLFKSVSELANLSAFLLYLAEAGNDRLTINQAAFFLMAAAGDLRGAPMTLSEIMERGEGVLTQSLKTTYKVLLSPKALNKEFGLSWLTREIDADDERRKYLRLTQKGRDVIAASLIAAGRAT